MKNEQQKNVIESLRKIFLKERGVLFCYLFGSRAYQNFTSKSDIDLAVYLDKEKSKDFFQERLLFMEKIERALKKRADVIILNEQKSIFFKYVILKEGKLIFERNHQKRTEYEFKALQDYYDFAPFLNDYNRSYIKNYV